MIINTAARSSNLSKRQVDEVMSEIKYFFPNIKLVCSYVRTSGDIDKKTSLRSMDKIDFFTREIDSLLLKGECRIAIHSAKDLPDPIPSGLQVVAYTKGVSPQDAIVTRDEESFTNLGQGAIVATSSIRREEMVRKVKPDAEFVDIRGTIEERLDVLYEKKIDAVVIAKAALIRLNLTHVNHILLEEKTAKGQGQLAIVARSDDVQMQKIFQKMNHGLV